MISAILLSSSEGSEAGMTQSSWVLSMTQVTSFIFTMLSTPRTKGTFSFTCRMTQRAFSHRAVSMGVRPKLIMPSSSGGVAAIMMTSPGWTRLRSSKVRESWSICTFTCEPILYMNVRSAGPRKRLFTFTCPLHAFARGRYSPPPKPM